MKRMLINATQSEELRVAIVEVESQNLLDLIVERQSYKSKTGNIYLAKISSIEPSLDATFANFGSERHGFLPLKEIGREYFGTSDPKKMERMNVRELIKEGQTVMVQVEKEERGNKGAALTTFISLAGSYLVLMPNNPRAGGISRRVEGEDRDELREILSNLKLPEDMGLIVRTAGVGKSQEELQWDLNALLKQWDAIKKASEERSPPFLIHQESDIVIRTMRDYLRRDILEILVDDVTLYERIKNYLEQIRPDFLHCLKLYSDNIPLFNRYQIEHQIESAHQREVRLPSGGSIVIDHTEALVAVDVNSAKATKGSDIEETALRTNLEAAEKIAWQLRLRDLGGLVVIDFIDMSSVRHRREVETHLRNALKLDKARTQIGSISQRFGLLEMSRQRLRPSLGEATQVVCPRCSGWGTIRGVESLALAIIRMIEEDAVKPHTAQIQVQLPIDIATFIINEKREALASIEQQRRVQIVIVPNPHLESPRYRIKRVTEDEVSGGGKSRASYHLLETHEPEPSTAKKAPFTRAEEKPAVRSILPSEPAPTSRGKSSSGLIKRILSSLFGNEEEKPEGKPVATPSAVAASTPASTTATPTVTPPSRPPHSQQHRSGSGRQRRDGKPGTSSTHKEPRKTAPQAHVNKPVKEETPAAPGSATTTAGSTTTTAGSTGEFKSRSRRGARGGRRRSGGSGNSGGASNNPTHTSNVTQQQQPSSTLPASKPEESLPDHLPPFPTDLEDYYQESVRPKVVKPARPTSATPVKIESDVSESNESPKPSVTPEPTVPVAKTEPAPAMPITEPQPVIIRAQPTKGSVTPPPSTSGQKSESAVDEPKKGEVKDQDKDT